MKEQLYCKWRSQESLMRRSPVVEIYAGVFGRVGAAALVVVEAMVGVMGGTRVVVSYMKKLRAWGCKRKTK